MKVEMDKFIIIWKESIRKNKGSKQRLSAALDMLLSFKEKEVECKTVRSMSKDWERIWFAKSNSWCLCCIENCKQSRKIKVLLCPNYTPKNSTRTKQPALTQKLYQLCHESFSGGPASKYCPACKIKDIKRLPGTGTKIPKKGSA